MTCNAQPNAGIANYDWAVVEVYAKPRAPELLNIYVCTSDSGLDLRTVTRAELHVGCECDVAVKVWPLVIVGVTTMGQIHLAHVWQANEIDAPDQSLRCQVVLIVPNGERRCAPFILSVL
jgi:hypothetical protein